MSGTYKYDFKPKPSHPCDGFNMFSFKSWLVEDGLLKYPINELDEAVYQETGKPPSGKYAKMLTRATPLVDQIWRHCLQFKQTFHDIEFLLKFPITERVVYCFIENCVVIDLKMQIVIKAMTKAKQEKEIEEYYKSDYEFLSGLNIFDLTFIDVERLFQEQKFDLDINELKQYYSSYMKKVKKDVK